MLSHVQLPFSLYFPTLSRVTYIADSVRATTCREGHRMARGKKVDKIGGNGAREDGSVFAVDYPRVGGELPATGAREKKP
jgi:hypothetical protein